jgi:hypothetical protein
MIGLEGFGEYEGEEDWMNGLFHLRWLARAGLELDIDQGRDRRELAFRLDL